MIELETFSINTLFLQILDICLECNSPKCKNDFDAWQETELLCPVAFASLDFLYARLVLWGRASHDCGHVGVGQLQAIVRANGGGLVCKPETVQRSHEKLGRAVSSKHSASSIAPMCSRGKPEN